MGVQGAQAPEGKSGKMPGGKEEVGNFVGSFVCCLGLQLQTSPRA